MKTLFHTVTFIALAFAFTVDAAETPVPFPGVIECRFTGNESIGVKLEPVAEQPGKVRITTFNGAPDGTVVLEPLAEFNDAFSEQNLYVKWFSRYQEFGMYGEYLIGRFIPGGRKFNPGALLSTESMFVKDPVTGLETEELTPLSRQPMKCQQGSSF